MDDQRPAVGRSTSDPAHLEAGRSFLPEEGSGGLATLAPQWRTCGLEVVLLAEGHHDSRWRGIAALSNSLM